MVTPEKMRRIRRAAEVWLGLPARVRAGSRFASTSSRCAGRELECVRRAFWRSRTRKGCSPRISRDGATQDALYAELDLELSWSERELPERERTKHVHRLHPYLGKFIPQLVEELLRRHVAAGGRVLDPFAGSGTTLVQSLESGHDATGIDLAAFNCLLMRVKTARYNLFTLEHDLRDALARFERGEGAAGGSDGYVGGVVRAAGRRATCCASGR